MCHVFFIFSREEQADCAYSLAAGHGCCEGVGVLRRVKFYVKSVAFSSALYFLQSPLKRGAAVVEKSDLITDAFHIREDMCGEDNRGMVFDGQKNIQDLFSAKGVQGRSGFVVDQQFWFV